MDHALTRWSKGSVRDRLCLPDCLRASGPGSYIVLWRSCIGPPSQPKLALSLPIKGLTYWLADRARWRGGRPFGRHFLCRLWRRKPYNRPAGVGESPFTMKTLLYCKKGAKSPPKTKSSNFLTISRLRSKTLWPSPAPNLTV